jgi:hypothetical protein
VSIFAYRKTNSASPAAALRLVLELCESSTKSVDNPVDKVPDSYVNVAGSLEILILAKNLGEI